MKSRLMYTLLGLMILCQASLGWSRENLSNPTVFSGPGLNSDPNRCQIINVYSYSLAGDRVYAQVGVGWVIQTSQQYRILVPSHVVAGAEMLTGRCGGRAFPLVLKGKSETLDLALLDIVSDTNRFLFPLISTEDRNDFLKTVSKDQRANVASMAPEHSKSNLLRALSRQEDNYYLIPSSTPNYPAQIKASDLLQIGFAHIEKGVPSLFLESLAIRPGFSGSPFFVTSSFEATGRDADLAILNGAMFDKPYLAGMLTKAEINGSRSLGVSLPDILEALPRLISSSDIDAGRPIRLRYTEKVNGGVLERKQELVQSSSDGSQKIYSEICNDSNAESSEWVPKNTQPNVQTKVILKELSKDSQKARDINVEDLIKAVNDLQSSQMGSMQQQRTGGDYGEGGGSLYGLKNAIFMIPIRIDDYTPHGLQSSYKVIKNCAQPMLKDQNGKIFDSINVGGRTLKTTSLNELYNVLTSATSGANSCVRTGLSMDQWADPTAYRKDGEIYFYSRYEGSTGGNGSSGYIDCNGTNTHVKFSNQNIAVDASFSKSGSSQGTVALQSASGQGCNVQLNSKNTRAVGSWKQQIRTKDLDIDVTFGSDDRAMSFKVLRTSAACNPYKDGKLWMYEINFSDTLSKLKRVMGP